jgi:RNA polymerase sigma factor (sigma-70 family)
MPRRTESTDENFNQLLAWLHSDIDTAALMYEAIRADLIRIFRWRGCSDPEGMADETIIRVTRKVEQIAGSYIGSPTHYFFGVARNLFHEYQRRREASLSTQAGQILIAAPVEEGDSKERLHECFERCLKELKPCERKLIVRYHKGRGLARINRRKRMALELGIDLNALRVRARRIRGRLRQCIEECRNGEAPVS